MMQEIVTVKEEERSDLEEIKIQEIVTAKEERGEATENEDKEEDPDLKESTDRLDDLCTLVTSIKYFFLILNYQGNQKVENL